jgi:hypothetical protein
LIALQLTLAKLAIALFALQTALAATIVPVPANHLTATQILQAYPVLERISACESTGDMKGTPRQFNSDGTPLWGNDVKTGKPIKRDVGIFQINTIAHAAELSKLGLDVISNIDDNADYALILYERDGTEPWDASKNCWGN